MKENEGLSWIANTLVFSGSAAIASGFPAVGFSLGLAGSLAFMLYGVQSGIRSFLFFNIIYSAVNLFGIINWSTK